MPQPPPEEPEDRSQPEQARDLAEFMATEEFQSLSMAEKFARLQRFTGPKTQLMAEHLKALFQSGAAQSERAARLREFQASDEYRGLTGRARHESFWKFLREVYDKLPKTAAEAAFENYLQSDEVRRGHLANDQAATDLQAIRVLSSAQSFLRRMGPNFTAELIEIARQEELSLPDIRELTPALREALERAGWQRPDEMREF